MFMESYSVKRAMCPRGFDMGLDNSLRWGSPRLSRMNIGNTLILTKIRHSSLVVTATRLQCGKCPFSPFRCGFDVIRRENTIYIARWHRTPHGTVRISGYILTVAMCVAHRLHCMT